VCNESLQQHSLLAYRLVSCRCRGAGGRSGFGRQQQCAMMLWCSLPWCGSGSVTVPASAMPV
jgi:hypothetical protein